MQTGGRSTSFQKTLRDSGEAIWRTSCPDRTRRSRLFDPIGDENVGFVWGAATAVRSPYKTLSVRGEHRERVEARVVRDAFQTRAVLVDDVQVKAARVVRVACA